MARFDNARCEAYARFREFAEEFDRSFKTGIAAMFHVTRLAEREDGPDLITKLIHESGQNWSNTRERWRDAAAYMNLAIGDASRLGLVQVHSAIDDFLINLQADLDRWNALSSTNFLAYQGSTPSQSAEQLEKACVRFGWECHPFKQWHAVLLFFRLARDCVAHRSGQASIALAEAREAAAKALDGWAKRDEGKPPSMPDIMVDSAIDLTPRQVILALDAANRACAYLNAKAVAHLGQHGLVHLAAHYRLFVDDPRVWTSAYQSPEAVVNHALSSRYLVEELNAPATIAALKDVGIWQRCRQRHAEIYGDPPRPRG